MDEILEQAGIPSKEQLMGLIMSIESNGCEASDLDKANDDWKRYYGDNDYTDYGWTLCHLIQKADFHNLYKLSKAYPAHVRIFAEAAILANVDKDKLEKIMNTSEETFEQQALENIKSGEING